MRTQARTAAVAALAVTTLLLAACSPDGSGVITESSTTPVATSPSMTNSSSPAPATSAPATSITAATSSPTGETSQTSPQPSVAWPADFTPAQQEAAQAALATVGGYTSLLSAANADPAGEDWATEFRRFAVEGIAEQTAATVRTLQDAGVHMASPLSYEDANVTAADDYRVSAEVCVDSSQAQLVDEQGQPVSLDAPQQRVVSFYTLAKFAPADGGWLILEEPTPAEPKLC